MTHLTGEITSGSGSAGQAVAPEQNEGSRPTKRRRTSGPEIPGTQPRSSIDLLAQPGIFDEVAARIDAPEAFGARARGGETLGGESAMDIDDSQGHPKPMETVGFDSNVQGSNSNDSLGTTARRSDIAADRGLDSMLDVTTKMSSNLRDFYRNNPEQIPQGFLEHARSIAANDATDDEIQALAIESLVNPGRTFLDKNSNYWREL